MFTQRKNTIKKRLFIVGVLLSLFVFIPIISVGAVDGSWCHYTNSGEFACSLDEESCYEGKKDKSIRPAECLFFHTSFFLEGNEAVSVVFPEINSIPGNWCYIVNGATSLSCSSTESGCRVSRAAPNAISGASECAFLPNEAAPSINGSYSSQQRTAVIAGTYTEETTAAETIDGRWCYYRDKTNTECKNEEGECYEAKQGDDKAQSACLFFPSATPDLQNGQWCFLSEANTKQLTRQCSSTQRECGLSRTNIIRTNPGTVTQCGFFPSENDSRIRAEYSERNWGIITQNEPQVSPDSTGANTTPLPGIRTTFPDGSNAAGTGERQTNTGVTDNTQNPRTPAGTRGSGGSTNTGGSGISVDTSEGVFKGREIKTYVPLSPLPFADDYIGEGERGVNISEAGIASFLNNLFRFGIGIGGLLAVIMITISGIQYIASAAFSTKQEAIKGLQASVGGFILILMSWIILSTISPDLLRLELEVPKTKTSAIEEERQKRVTAFEAVSETCERCTRANISGAITSTTFVRRGSNIGIPTLAESCPQREYITITNTEDPKISGTWKIERSEAPSYCGVGDKNTYNSCCKAFKVHWCYQRETGIFDDQFCSNTDFDCLSKMRQDITDNIEIDEECAEKPQ